MCSQVSLHSDDCKTPHMYLVITETSLPITRIQALNKKKKMSVSNNTIFVWLPAAICASGQQHLPSQKRSEDDPHVTCED